MAIANCKTHGRTGLVPVCEHLYQNVCDNSNPGKIITVTYYFGNFLEEPNSPMFVGFVYCLICARKHNLPKDNSVLPGSEADSAPWDDIKTVCVKCFREFLDKYKIVWSGFDIPVDNN